MGTRQKRAELNALPIPMVAGYGAQVARQRCLIFRASTAESTLKSIRLKSPSQDSYSSKNLQLFRGGPAMVDLLRDR